ncbi:unnamed protein product [Rotaria sordida]|uniref:Alpha-taxilin n=1 Tax=Rotaria sordida TaxID=392033 RepID=A0A814BFV5_9BILA|nr:unnamed protein product [Rotaria sordida]CAF3829716.1 unnamed protein product [Rotaria sordida]
MASNIESELNENTSFDSNQISTDEKPTQIIDTTNLSTTNKDTNIDESSPTTTNRTHGQTAIGAKLIEKLEKFAADSKENKQTNDKISSITNNDSSASSNTNNESEPHRNINEVATNLMETLTDSDPQKNLLILATKLVELQEQNRLTQAKINELEKRSTFLIRERDQILLENNRTSAAKSKLESLCRELHRHNQQIRDECTRRQQDDETKRQELAKKFQTTIDEITSQLSNYSTQSTSLRERNLHLSEQLASVAKEYELRETEFEAALKKKELELRLTEASLEQSHSVLNERTELIKQERQVSEAERLVLYKNCEELAASELRLHTQLKVYTERYQEFQNAIQQSSQMVTSCHTEIEKMGKKIKTLEQERNDFRHQWDIAEQNQRKSNEDMKLMEKEKRQLEIKLDKLDRLCRTLQQERSDLQTKIKNPTKSSTDNSSIPSIDNGASGPATVASTSEKDKTITSDVLTSSETPTNVHDSLKNDVVLLSTTSDTNG